MPDFLLLITYVDMKTLIALLLVIKIKVKTHVQCLILVKLNSNDYIKGKVGCDCISYKLVRIETMELFYL